jgi:hypothetical protein
MRQFHDVENVFSFRPSRVRGASGKPLTPVYRVGEPFRRDCSSWPQGAQFTYSPGGDELTIFRSDIDHELIDGVRRGKSEFAILVELPVIVLAYRFGESLPWNDIPYYWHLQPEEWRLVPSLDDSPESRALLWITLVGADDGIVHAQRGVTLSPRFTRALHTAIRDQAMSAFDPEECTLALSRIFLGNPHIADRLARAKVHTFGNE